MLLCVGGSVNLLITCITIDLNIKNDSDNISRRKIALVPIGTKIYSDAPRPDEGQPLFKATKSG